MKRPLKNSFRNGAQYFRATNTEQLENSFTALLISLEKTKIEVKKYTEYNEMFAHFFDSRTFLPPLEILLGQKKLRRIPLKEKNKENPLKFASLHYLWCLIIIPLLIFFFIFFWAFKKEKKDF